MAVLKLNNVPVITEAAGVAQMATTLKYPAGHIIQVVSTPITSGTGTSSASYVVTSIQGTITPTDASNKIWIMISTSVRGDTQTGNSGQGTICRGNGGYSSGNDLSPSGPMTAWVHNDNSSTGSIGGVSFSFLDSPNTTSAQTYAVYLKLSNGSYTRMPEDTKTTGVSANITLMEISQ